LEGTVMWDMIPSHALRWSCSSIGTHEGLHKLDEYLWRQHSSSGTSDKDQAALQYWRLLFCSYWGGIRLTKRTLKV
jgi:hypothetical protein